jgi:hypothetical protein
MDIGIFQCFIDVPCALAALAARIGMCGLQHLIPTDGVQWFRAWRNAGETFHVSKTIFKRELLLLYQHSLKRNFCILGCWSLMDRKRGRLSSAPPIIDMSPFAILAALLASPSCCWQVMRQKGFKNELLRAERFGSEYGVLVLGVFRLRVKRMRT